MQRTTETRARRLATYVALTAGVPVAATSGEVIHIPDLDIEIGLKESAYVDFGPGYGELFHIGNRMSYYSFPRGARFWDLWTNRHTVKFNYSYNTGYWNTASFRGIGSPSRLGDGALIGPGNSDWIRMASFGIGDSLLGARGDRYESFGAWGDWFGGTTDSNPIPGRGFLGVRMTRNAVDYTYAWIDIEALAGPPNGPSWIKIHAWALETTPNTPIRTPSPGFIGLALLALGAAGIRHQRALDA